MFPGPVFAVELLTTAKRARYYAMRAIYGLLLLFVLWITYHEFVESRGRGRSTFTAAEMSAFAAQTFSLFVTAQGLTVLAITPALVGGTIAGEKQRKTLLYLLASTLSSSEIVLGKLLARLLLVFVFLAAGVPMLFLLRFFGGIDVTLILTTFGVTVGFTVFLASMSIFFSTIMRQARSAIVAAYVTVGVVILAPLAAQMFAEIFPNAMAWAPDLVDYASPIINVGEIMNLRSAAFSADSILRMVGAQAVYSALFLSYSIWRLRAIAANDAAKPKTILRIDNRGRASWRPLPRPAIGADPMMWKERFSSRTGGVAKMLGLFNNLFWTVLIFVFTFEYARAVVIDLWSGRASASNRDDLLNVIRGITPYLAGFWLVGTTVTAASAIASEREDDTWLSLIATDLDGREIVRAKMLGSILRFRWMGLMLLTIWAIGMAGGAIHPVSFAIACFEMAVFLAFAAALGVRLSLTSSSTSKSLAITLGVFAMMNGGYLLACFPSPRLHVIAVMAGVMPWLVEMSLVSSTTLTVYFDFLKHPAAKTLNAWVSWPGLPVILGTTIYAGLAWSLTWRSFALFDRVADRPRIEHDGFEAPDPSPRS
jgi:ABC-type transport system involved in multi-copper enzyme maturation permease subunit